MRALFRLPRRFSGGLGFGARLILTLTLTLVISGAFQYWFTAREFHSYLMEEAGARAQADTILVEQAFDADLSSNRRLDIINQRLSAINKREGVQYVVLIDRF